MTYTRSQLHERISDLSGQYRAAQENKRLTSQKRAEDERLADLARQADEKADGHLIEIAAQIREAQAQYAAAVEELIAVPGAPIAVEAGPAPEATPVTDEFLTGAGLIQNQDGSWGSESAAVKYNSIFTEPADFHAQALQNGAERIEQAFRDAT